MKKFDNGKLSSTCRITGIDVAQLHGVNNNPGINGEAEFLGKLVKIYADGKLVAARIRAEFRELRKCDSSRICGFPIEYHRSITVKAKTWITANIFFWIYRYMHVMKFDYGVLIPICIQMNLKLAQIGL